MIVNLSGAHALKSQTNLIEILRVVGRFIPLQQKIINLSDG